MRRKSNRSRPKREFITANHRIRFPEVRVLDENGGMLGVMSTREAQEQARMEDKDLVLVTEGSKPPVVKIIELSKYKYQLKQRRSEQRKSARKQELKEIRFTPFMGDGDFESRLKKVNTFLEKGDKVRLTLLFRGRQITKKEFGYVMFDKIIDRTSEIAEVEMQPKMLGRKLIAQLTPVKKTTKANDKPAAEKK